MFRGCYGIIVRMQKLGNSSSNSDFSFCRCAEEYTFGLGGRQARCSLLHSTMVLLLRLDVLAVLDLDLDLDFPMLLRAVDSRQLTE